jgi:hypothetical protein
MLGYIKSKLFNTTQTVKSQELSATETSAQTSAAAGNPNIDSPAASATSSRKIISGNSNSNTTTIHSGLYQNDR